MRNRYDISAEHAKVEVVAPASVSLIMLFRSLSEFDFEDFTFFLAWLI
jgi:hypothetical protein